MSSHKLIKLREPRHQHNRRDDRFKQTNYKQSAPFFENPNGVLIHRIKALYKLETTYSKYPWLIVDYWCGNNGRTDTEDSGLLFDPGSKLVCARCEAMATAAEEQTSSELAGRHVCTGVCRPVNTCHPNETN